MVGYTTIRNHFLLKTNLSTYYILEKSNWE